MIADPQAAQSLYSFHLQWLLNMGFHVTDLANIASKPNSLLTATQLRRSKPSSPASSHPFSWLLVTER